LPFPVSIYMIKKSLFSLPCCICSWLKQHHQRLDFIRIRMYADGGVYCI
jgi:hypothetical protein